jgi:hypothetical protein
MALNKALGGLHFSPQQVEQVIQEVKAELPPQFHFRHGSSLGGSSSGDSVDILAAPLEVWNTEFGRDTTAMNVSRVQAVGLRMSIKQSSCCHCTASPLIILEYTLSAVHRRRTCCTQSCQYICVADTTVAHPAQSKGLKVLIISNACLSLCVDSPLFVGLVCSSSETNRWSSDE